jgi:hypothetical protein
MACVNSSFDSFVRSRDTLSIFHGSYSGSFSSPPMTGFSFRKHQKRSAGDTPPRRIGRLLPSAIHGPAFSFPSSSLIVSPHVEVASSQAASSSGNSILSSALCGRSPCAMLKKVSRHFPSSLVVKPARSGGDRARLGMELAVKAIDYRRCPDAETNRGGGS